MIRFAIALALLPGAVFGQERGQECVGIEDSLKRLTCYDAAFATNVTQSAKNPNGSAWDITEETDELTGKTILLALNESKGLLSCNRGEPAALFVRCDGKLLNVFIHHGCYAPGNNGLVRASMRFDDGRVTNRDMGASDTDRAFGRWRNSSAADFLYDLVEAKQLMLRFTPYKETPETVSFDLSGVVDVTNRMATQCTHLRTFPTE